MANKFADRLPFSLKGDFVVTKPIKINGKVLKVGDAFHPRHAALSDRRVRALYDGKFITMKGDILTAPEQSTENSQSPEEVVAGDGEFVYDPAVHRVEHEDSEYWIVDDDTDLVRVRAPMGKKLDVATEKTLVPADDVLAWAEDEE